MKSLVLHPAARAGVLADSINDADSTRKVYLLAAGLAALGIVLIAMTVWFWRSTRHDPELLAPLETMGSRRFRKMDDGSKRQLLDAVRPADAKPMRWGVIRGSATAEPEVDLGAIRHAAVSDYNDLREPAAPVIEVVAAVPVVTDSPVDGVAVDDVASVDGAADDEVSVDDSVAAAAIEPASDDARDVDTGEPAVITDASLPSGEEAVEPVATAPAASDDEPNPAAWVDPLVRPMVAADRPRFKPDPRAFVITPLDHDMPAPIDDDAADAPEASDDVAESDDDATVAGTRPAIDPLLRRFEHTD